MNKSGHSYYRFGSRNVAIIYRHSIWRAPDIIDNKVVNSSITFEPLDIDCILFHSDFDLKQIKRDILTYPNLVWGIMGRVSGQIVGFCVIYLKGSKTTQYRVEMCDAYIDCVCVSEEFRGHGIAQIILGNAIKIIRENGGNEILLAVRRNNESMIHAIKKAGFRYVKQSFSVRFLGIRIIYPLL